VKSSLVVDGSSAPPATAVKSRSIASSASVGMQFLRYLVVGGAAFCVDFGVLILLTDLIRIHYLVSAAIGFCCGLATNYILCINWVFSARSLSNTKAEFMIFAVIGLIGLGWNELLLYAGTDGLHLDYRVSKLITVGIVLAWNFGMRKLLLFNKLEA
jgi:putative flippase GtrA